MYMCCEKVFISEKQTVNVKFVSLTIGNQITCTNVNDGWDEFVSCWSILQGKLLTDVFK